MNWEIHWEKEGAIIEFKNAITVFDIVDADLRLRGDSRFVIIKYVIYNYLNIDSKNLTKDDPKVSVAIDNPAIRWNNSLTSINVTKDPYLIKLIHDYIEKIETPSWNHIIADSMENARIIISKI